MDIAKRITEIDQQLKELIHEKEELQKANSIIAFWSPENIQHRLRKLISKNYGDQHDIKIAIFKPNCEYNDEGYTYHDPLLILIDSKFNELDHNIRLYGTIIPSDDNQYEYYEAAGKDLYIEDITIKF